MKSIKKIIFLKSLTAIFCIGLFAFNLENNYISNEKHSKLLLKPIDGLNNEQTDIFMLGRSFFNIPWVKAPSVTTARDGLGPLFNANSCISCHPKNGRGELFSLKYLCAENYHLILLTILQLKLLKLNSQMVKLLFYKNQNIV